jgi:hypothetical protein
MNNLILEGLIAAETSLSHSIMQILTPGISSNYYVEPLIVDFEEIVNQAKINSNKE